MTCATTEEWRPIPFAPGYEASSLGRVRSFLGGKARVLKPLRHKSGYVSVKLHSDGRVTQLYIHQIVLTVFVGPCPPGMESRHVNDNDRANNRLDNLAWGTRAENAADRERHGTVVRGDRHPSRLYPERRPRGSKHALARLTEAAVIDIVMNEDGLSVGKLAEKYGVCDSAVRHVLSGRRWVHLTSQIARSA